AENPLPLHRQHASYSIAPAQAANCSPTDPSPSYVRVHTETRAEPVVPLTHTHTNSLSLPGHAGHGTTQAPEQDGGHDHSVASESDTSHTYEQSQRAEENTTTTRPSPTSWQAQRPPTYLPYTQDRVEQDSAPMASLQDSPRHRESTRYDSVSTSAQVPTQQQ